MKEITQELIDRNCLVCMNCGKVYEEATGADFMEDKCSCSMGWMNRLNGTMDDDFWGTAAAQALAERKNPKTR